MACINGNLIIFLAICITCIMLISACSKPGSKTNEHPCYSDVSSEEEDKNIKQTTKNEIIEEPLSESEKLEVSKQSLFLQNAEIEKMNEKTADSLAEYFIRCQRLEISDATARIITARYDAEPRKPWTTNRTWEYWVLSTDAGTDYWLVGFTSHNAFNVYFIYRGTLDGELLYGYYQ